MAPKPQSRQPTKEKQENEEPSSEEEEEDDDEEESGSESESESSDEVKANLPNEEDEEASSEDEEEEDEEQDDEQEKLKNNKIPPPVPKFEAKSTAKENGSDSDPESEGSPSDYKLQPISKTPLAAKKRTHQESDTNQLSVTSSKKSRTEEQKCSTSTPGGGMGCITRLWSNEDEIAALNGMIDFKNVKGLEPYADMGAFYNFVKGKLQVDFSKDQLRTKINRMKKRFLNAMKKSENGSDPVFSKPHEDMAFELSKKIWGGIVGNNNEVHENVKKDIVKVEKSGVDEEQIVKKEKDGEEGVNWSKYPFLSRSFGNLAGNFPSLVMSEVGMSFMKERLSLIGNAKAEELNEKWKQLIAEEAEVNHKMVNLMMEQVKMALDQ